MLKARRRGHRAVGVPLAAYAIAHLVQRLQDLFGELAAFGQDSVHRIGRRFGKARKVVVALDLENIVEQKGDLLDGGRVTGHSGLG